MDAKLTQMQFKNVSEAAYPSYVLKINKICTSKCFSKTASTEDDKNLTGEETKCLDTCARLYIRSLEHMLNNFEKRTI